MYEICVFSSSFLLRREISLPLVFYNIELKKVRIWYDSKNYQKKKNNTRKSARLNESKCKASSYIYYSEEVKKKEKEKKR